MGKVKQTKNPVQPKTDSTPTGDDFVGTMKQILAVSKEDRKDAVAVSIPPYARGGRRD